MAHNPFRVGGASCRHEGTLFTPVKRLMCLCINCFLPKWVKTTFAAPQIVQTEEIGNETSNSIRFPKTRPWEKNGYKRYALKFSNPRRTLDCVCNISFWVGPMNTLHRLDSFKWKNWLSYLFYLLWTSNKALSCCLYIVLQNWHSKRNFLLLWCDWK